METTVEASIVFRGNVQIPHPRIINVPKVVYMKYREYLLSGWRGMSYSAEPFINPCLSPNWGTLGFRV